MTRRLSLTQRSFLLACVFAGLFLMHGVQATPSPVHAAGAVVGAASHSHGMTADSMAIAGSAATASSATEDCPGGRCGESHAGTVCFALLALTGLLLLVAAIPAGSWPSAPAGRHLLFVRRGPPRPRPPTIYQLSVLRL